MGKIDFDKFLIDYANSGFLKKRMLVNYLLEKQGLQIVNGEIVPIEDKKEPKFKVGDWVTDGIAKCQILFIDDTQYWYSENCILGSIESIDKKYHLWTIQDAKKGDVLCRENGWTGIFKALDNHTNTFSSYCFMDTYKLFCNTGCASHTLDKTFIKAYNAEIHPATKEQCDTLMKAMADAGYQWNAEELKLEKIEQKQEWNGEDERALNDAIVAISMYANGNISYILPSQLLEDVEQLKSIKERYTWKPSEEQMEALRIARDRNDKIGFYLSQLYDDLKKLM